MFFRDCKVCKKYFHDKNGLVKDVLQRPIERGANQQTVCTGCPKYDKDTKECWTNFSPRNSYIFRSFLLARAFHVLPCYGGTDNQDPLIMEIFIVLSQMFEQQTTIEEREFQLKLAGNTKGIM